MILGNWPFFSLVPFTMASMMLGWSDPRFTKQWVTPSSHSASKKANDVVYMLSGLSSEVERERVLVAATGALAAKLETGSNGLPDLEPAKRRGVSVVEESGDAEVV
jgi:hypothetical protein